MNDYVCYFCLTDESRNVPAVTMSNGTPVCERCAREIREAENELRERMTNVRPAPSLEP